ncbi:hypothetical protein JQX08_22015 [Pseudomonas sp. UL073]|uniref:Uncharacterized protein n=1 Tax=Zestomonas insulae TaxID=2809017 RepID=A0ABS2IKZ9_9GAMM|nr:hypothetical protein [Pseudomonas insulae]MBM7063405.1 hypothetical protein [Pseudomonas insulae]
MASKSILQKLILLGALLPALLCSAAEPRFDDYKVLAIFDDTSNAAAAGRQSDDAQSDLREQAAKQPANFAGHYIVLTSGCGGGAICGEILDAKSGRAVTGLPNAYLILSEDGTSAFDAIFQENSRLIIISGIAADPELGLNNEPIPRKDRTRYYEFDGKSLKLLYLAE